MRQKFIWSNSSEPDAIIKGILPFLLLPEPPILKGSLSLYMNKVPASKSSMITIRSFIAMPLPFAGATTGYEG